MKPLHFLLATTLLATAWFAFFDNDTPSDIVEPVVRGPSQPASETHNTTAKTVPAKTNKSVGEPFILALVPREQLISTTRGEQTSSGLFSSQTWTPPPPPPALPAEEPPPTAPPLPFTYLGKKTEDGVWEVYLGRGDRSLIARQGEVIDDIYRIESIKPPTMSLTYLPLNQVQTLAIGGID